VHVCLFHFILVESRLIKFWFSDDELPCYRKGKQRCASCTSGSCSFSPAVVPEVKLVSARVIERVVGMLVGQEMTEKDPARKAVLTMCISSLKGEL